MTTVTLRVNYPGEKTSTGAISGLYRTLRGYRTSLNVGLAHHDRELKRIRDHIEIKRSGGFLLPHPLPSQFLDAPPVFAAYSDD
jgi:hypothetical protein